MATDAQIKTVRQEARIYGYEYFSNYNGTKLELLKQQPPITVYSVVKNKTTTLTADTNYTFDDYRTITLTTAAADSDVFKVEYGTTVTNAEISDVVDYSKEEVYAELGTYYTSTNLTTSTYVADLYEKLAAGYIILKYWEGYTRGEDFWNYGRNLIDTVHKRIQEIKDGEKQLRSTDTTVVSKENLAFKYALLDYAQGLKPSEIYTFKAEDTDEEVY